MFLACLYLFLFLGGEFIFDWLELVELFRLYLGASLCTLSFLALATLFLPCWVIHVRGSIFFLFLVSNCLLIYDYEFFIVICLYCVLFDIKILFFFTCIFFQTCGYAFCLSVSGNIQVDSIKLLSTLATDG